MLNPNLFPLFILLLHAPDLISQPELIKAKAEECKLAFLREDFGKMADLTYPLLVAKLGGREAYIKTMRKNIEEMKARGFSLDTVMVWLPTRIITTKRRMYGVVPCALIMNTPRGKFRQESTMLGISDDKGASWTFIDANNDAQEMVQVIFPDEKGLIKRLALPAQKLPRRIEE